ncbi:MAG: TIGR02647 family protein [Pseudomonadales bacterium]|jgi:uncharacterized protein (TIGR02647 family)|nr:TIGR02647 family protein [Pseudomonadales bacterium]
MHLNNEFVEDVELLALFRLDSAQEGLKIHHDAAPERLSAAQRLFDKKLTSLADGGYLTPLGIQAAEHAHALLRILREDGWHTAP